MDAACAAVTARGRMTLRFAAWLLHCQKGRLEHRIRAGFGGGYGGGYEHRASRELDVIVAVLDLLDQYLHRRRRA